MDANAWSAVSAIAAAVAAIVSLYQIFEIRRTASSDEAAAKKLRTFEHAPASSPRFFEAQFALSNHFIGWTSGEAVTEEQARATFADKELMANFNYVLNHYGRMAAAYHYDVIDKEVAENLYKFGYLRFWNLFRNYLESEFARRPQLAQQYRYSRELFERWSAAA